MSSIVGTRAVGTETASATAGGDGDLGCDCDCGSVGPSGGDPWAVADRHID